MDLTIDSGFDSFTAYDANSLIVIVIKKIKKKHSVYFKPLNPVIMLVKQKK